MAHMKVGQISSSSTLISPIYLFSHFKYLMANKCLPWWGLDSSFTFLNCWKSSHGLGNHQLQQPSRETNSQREKEIKVIVPFATLAKESRQKATLSCRRVNSIHNSELDGGEAIDSQLDVIGSIWSNIRLANINGTCISNSTRYACTSATLECISPRRWIPTEQ